MSHRHSQRSLLLVPSELGQLKLLGKVHRISPAIARRVQLIETAQKHPDWSAKQLAQALHRHESWVRKWQQRWQETQSLADAPRSGAPRQFSSEVRAQVTALACSLPRSHGVPLARWSRVELARHVATVPTLPTISARTIGRWLEAEQTIPGGIIAGNTSRSLKHFSCVPVRCCACMNRPHPYSIRASGWSAQMRKPRSRRVRPNKLPVQPSSAPRVSIPTLSPSGSIALDGRLECGRWAGLWSVPSAQTLRRLSLFFRDDHYCRGTPSGSADRGVGLG